MGENFFFLKNIFCFHVLRQTKPYEIEITG
jgi:hypothetical protein